MKVEVRQAVHPEAVRHADTDDLRRHFLIETVFVPGEVRLVYSHLDRMVVGGAMPTDAPLVLPAPTAIGTPSFLARRELGVVNIGGPARVSVGGTEYALDRLDVLYAGMGAGEVRFASADPADPARLYLVSAPAHRSHPSRLISRAEARMLDRGTPAEANQRIIYQAIHPEICQSCQLVLGMTLLKPNNVWNTMPAHTHDRRSEAYLYFDMSADDRVFHFLGEPRHTRHMVVANEQAILSPGWSIHSGAGTANYSFVWAMAGDNVEFDDMDWVEMGDLR